MATWLWLEPYGPLVRACNYQSSSFRLVKTLNQSPPTRPRRPRSSAHESTLTRPYSFPHRSQSASVPIHLLQRQSVGSWAAMELRLSLAHCMLAGMKSTDRSSNARLHGKRPFPQLNHDRAFSLELCNSGGPSFRQKQSRSTQSDRLGRASTS